MFRFIVDKKISETHFELSKETLKHLKVVRAEKEEFICVFQNKFYICSLDGENALILKELKEQHEHNKQVILAAAIINIKRFEWLIQKATELGATKFIPVLSERVVVKTDNLNKKIARWEQIIHNATEQSFRNSKMKILKPMKLKEVLEIQVSNKFIAHEKNGNKVDQEYPTDSIFLIGPEGGFTDEEISLSKSNGFEVISLGKRILRAETAGIFVLSKISQ